MIVRWRPPLAALFWVVVADYFAQVPYFLVNYYFPHQTPPSVSAIVLLGLTLAWFLLGYFGFRAQRRYGYWLLLSFLIIEGLFYLGALLFGVAVLQLRNPNLVIRIVFLVGYFTGLVSLTYAVLLLVFRQQYIRPSHDKDES